MDAGWTFKIFKFKIHQGGLHGKSRYKLESNNLKLEHNTFVCDHKKIGHNKFTRRKKT